MDFRPRRTGISKYGPGRIVRTFLDLMTVKFLSGYSTAADPGVRRDRNGAGRTRRLWTLSWCSRRSYWATNWRNRPALLLAVLLVVVGVQFVSIGLLGEMLARTYHESQDKPIYVIKEEF